MLNFNSRGRCIKLKKLIFIIGLFFAFSLNVNAASNCSFEEQSSLKLLVSNIKMTNELDRKLVQYPDMEDWKTYYKISILNLSKEFYAVITNSVNNDKATLKGTDDGEVIYEWDDISEKATINIQIYTSSETGCPDELYKTFVTTTSRYNRFHQIAACDRYPEFNLCQEFVNFDDISDEEFFERLENYKKTLEQSKDKDDKTDNEGNFSQFVDRYKWYFMAILIISSGIGIVVYVRYMKSKKRRELLK